MVKSTVRFPETVIEHVEVLVEKETFSSKSEFQRFAVEYMLSETTDYDPEIVDFDDICTEVLPGGSAIQQAETTVDSDDEFIETAARVRQFAARGEMSTAEEYIDTQYPPTDPRSMILDDLLMRYRDNNDRD